MKESYLASDFRKTAAQRFPAQAGQLNAAFDARLRRRALLAEHACDSDDISYAGLPPKLLWRRTTTLGRGGDRCDFCLKIQK